VVTTAKGIMKMTPKSASFCQTFRFLIALRLVDH
jgi:hypothetical protein